VRCPVWWPYPERCGNGHEWGPGLVLVSWQQCHCAGAQMLHPDRAIWGHFTVACREPGCRSVWYDPPPSRARRHERPGHLAYAPLATVPGAGKLAGAHGAPG
jgi:hypothetical protein